MYLLEPLLLLSEAAEARQTLASLSTGYHPGFGGHVVHKRPLSTGAKTAICAGLGIAVAVPLIMVNTPGPPSRLAASGPPVNSVATNKT